MDTESTGGGASKTFGASTSLQAIQIRGYVQNGANGGTVRFQWAQNALEAVDTTVKGGNDNPSFLLVYRH